MSGTGGIPSSGGGGVPTGGGGGIPAGGKGAGGSGGAQPDDDGNEVGGTQKEAKKIADKQGMKEAVAGLQTDGPSTTKSSKKERKTEDKNFQEQVSERQQDRTSPTTSPTTQNVASTLSKAGQDLKTVSNQTPQTKLNDAESNTPSLDANTAAQGVVKKGTSAQEPVLGQMANRANLTGQTNDIAVSDEGVSQLKDMLGISNEPASQDQDMGENFNLFEETDDSGQTVRLSSQEYGNADGLTMQNQGVSRRVGGEGGAGGDDGTGGTSGTDGSQGSSTDNTTSSTSSSNAATNKYMGGSNAKVSLTRETLNVIDVAKFSKKVDGELAKDLSTVQADMNKEVRSDAYEAADEEYSANITRDVGKIVGAGADFAISAGSAIADTGLRLAKKDGFSQALTGGISSTASAANTAITSGTDMAAASKDREAAQKKAMAQYLASTAQSIGSTASSLTQDATGAQSQLIEMALQNLQSATKAQYPAQ